VSKDFRCPVCIRDEIQACRLIRSRQTLTHHCGISLVSREGVVLRWRVDPTRIRNRTRRWNTTLTINIQVNQSIEIDHIRFIRSGEDICFQPTDQEDRQKSDQYDDNDGNDDQSLSRQWEFRLDVRISRNENRLRGSILRSGYQIDSSRRLILSTSREK